MVGDASTKTEKASSKGRASVRIDREWLAADVSPIAQSLVAEGLGEELSVLLSRRGVSSRAQAEEYLNPSLEQLHDGSLLPGLDEAVERLIQSSESKERVAVVGDYDADGISGTALLTACLRLAGINTEPILPHRLRDGYGFQDAQVERASELGCGLIVTVDCGMSSRDAVAFAAARGMQTIVTDHHLPSDELPEAIVLVNPRLDDEQPPYPNVELCGAGIAFKLGVALLETLGLKVPIHSLLRVACLGTIADLVPLTGENRSIAALGLTALGQSRSPGLVALMQVSRVKAPVLAEDVGYRLAPRLNAAGRLDSPDRALELLLTRDETRARQLASDLDDLNQERQSAERLVVREARAHFLEMDEMPRILVAASESWHRGVVGIAAGRLAREFHRPTILLGAEGTEATGSGRSIELVHLHEFLMPWKDQMMRFGGHSQAIGMTVEVARLPQLIDQWNDAAAAWEDEILIKRYRYELEVDSVDFLRNTLYELLEKFQPFGQANPAPLIRVGPLSLARPARIFGKGHLDLLVQDASNGRIRTTAWNWADKEECFGGRFELLARMGWDDYTGAAAMTLVDARPI